MLNDFWKRAGTRSKDFSIVFILLFTTFMWYYLTLGVVTRYFSPLDVEANYMQFLSVLSIYHVAIIASSIFGSILSEKIERLPLLYVWMFLGTGLSLLPALFDDITMMTLSSIYLLWGISFGIGMPSCLAYFADCTKIENRGVLSGIIFFFILILFGISNLMVNYIVLVVLRGAGLAIFYLLRPDRKTNISETKKNISYNSIFHDKLFLFYFIPWLMFCFIDRFEEPILTSSQGYEPIAQSVQASILLIGSISALIGGLLSDRIGRKKVVLYGFVTLGIAYAIIGIDQTEGSLSWPFYFVIGSIATGILWVTFILTLWGDLSQPGSREKYYVIGEIPFFLTGVIQLISAPYVLQIPVTGAFSLASFFLFLAVFPLLYARETLPERKIQIRQLRRYVEAAKKVLKKYADQGEEEEG